MIERVDMLVQRIGQGLDMQNTTIDQTVETVERALLHNQRMLDLYDLAWVHDVLWV